MHVLRRFREAVIPGGIVLDLQVIRPDPRVEAEGRLVYVADGSPLFEGADAARAAVEQLDSASAHFLGAVLNKVDILRHPYYYSSYYRKDYSRYYVSAS